ncbi:TPA: AraC family transcriptional regulator, partial [Acinetobacter baumannii]|nr:AraC family transcriptional regulator [Acinetobacter baumannii]
MNQANSHELNGRHFQNEPIFTDHNLVFDHHDLSETCRNVGQIFKPHDLKISHQKRDFSATMHHVKTGALSISRLEYGADVIIEPDHLDNFYLIQIPTQGYAEIEFGSQKFISYSQVASLISPQQSLRMRWHANSPQLILKVSKDDFTYHCRQHIADSENNLLIFDPKLDFSTQGGAYFLQLVRTL